MSVNDDLFDAGNRHQIYLLRFGGGATKRVLALLEEAEKDLVSRLATRASKLTAIQTKRYKALIQAIREQSRDVSIAMQKTFEKDLKGLAYQEFDIADRNLTRAVGVDLNNFRPPPEVVNSLVTKQAVRQRTLRSWFKQLEDDRARRLESAVGLGLVEGDTLPQMVRRFRDSEKITRRQAETLVRTHVNHVGNHAKRAFYEANSDIIKSVRWTSTLDGRTSSICQARDGKTYPLGGGPTPPAHPNCRSVLVPVTKSWSELAGEKLKPGRGAKEMRGLFEKNLAAQGFGPEEIKRIQANTRASMNGQVPEGMTYQKWLQRQPQAFQDDVLGPTRGQLFRDGGLTLSKFVDDKAGQPLTLDQIKSRNQKAWDAVIGGGRPVTEDTVFADMKAMLGKDVDPEAVKNWASLMGESPQDFMDRYHKGVPFETKAQRFLGGENNGNARVGWETRFLDKDGRQIGKQARYITQTDTGLAAVHQFFQINQDYRGAGKTLLANSIEEYLRLGVNRVTVHANIDVGGYAWAKYGFRPYAHTIDEVKGDLAYRLAEIRKGFPENVSNAIQAIIDEGGEDILWKIADMKTPFTINGKTQSIGKHMLLGTSWHGQLDLTNAESLERFRKYVGK